MCLDWVEKETATCSSFPDLTQTPSLPPFSQATFADPLVASRPHQQSSTHTPSLETHIPFLHHCSQRSWG